MPVFTHGVSVLVSFLQSAPGQMFFVIPLVVLVLDFLSGVARAVRAGTFRLVMVSDFASHHLVAYLTILLSFLILPVLSGVPIEAAAAAGATGMTAFVVAQLASITENAAELFGAPEPTVAFVVRSLLGRVFPGLKPELLDASAPTASDGTAPAASEGPQA